MKKSKIISLALSVLLLVGVITGIAISASASGDVTEQDWISAPSKALKKCEGGDCDHTGCDYVYSFAVVGDTQNLNIYDVNNNTEYMKALYSWILQNKDSKNIVYSLGLGDITQAYYRGYSSGIWVNEWENAAEALSVLDGKLGYSLVRGNHDITDATDGFNGVFGIGDKTVNGIDNQYYEDLVALSKTTDNEGRPMAGFLNANKVEDTYRKMIVGGHKYIIFTIDWHPTEECLDWIDEVLAENGDYRAIFTLHSFIYRDGTITDDYEDTFPYENLTGSRPNWEEVSASGGQVHPKQLWQDVLSKHANVELILCGHIDEDDIITTQLKGENGNTVTAMLIDGQTIDKEVEPVGLVAMLYFSADGRVVNVEYISTTRAAAGKAAYLRDKNQFEVTLDYSTATESGWTDTPHGSIRTDIYNAYPFHILMDDDSDESTDAFYFGSYEDWQSTLKAIHDFAGNTRPSSHKKMKTYYIVMSCDYTDSYKGIHDNRATNNFGKTVLDLNGKTLTLAAPEGNSVFLPFYVTSAGKYPRFGIMNGNIKIAGNNYLAVTQSGASANGERGTLELADLNITYDLPDGVAANPLVTTYDGSAAGNYLDLILTNCNIDSSSVPGAVTLFDLDDVKNNALFNVTVKGGSIKGGTAANTTVFSTNGIYDKITFVKDTAGNYTSLTLADSGEVEGVYYTDVAEKFVEFGSPVAKDGAYSYSLVDSSYELTEYGMIDTVAYPASTYPFALFKDGKMIHAASKWNTLINTDIKGNATYQSGCTLLLRRDYNTHETSGNVSYFCYIDDLTIDLGNNTLTRGTYHLFQLMGYDATEHNTKIRIINGTLAADRVKQSDGKSATSPLICFNNNANNTGADSFEIILDGITLDITNRGIVTCYADGTLGSNSKVILNDCTINRGTTTYTTTLFALAESSGNKNNIEVTVNGGKLVTAKNLSSITVATYSEELVAGMGSPDKVTFGKGSDGKYLTVEVPAGTSVPDTSYLLTDGTYYLSKNATEGSKDIYTFEKATTVFGDVTKTYVNSNTYPFAVFVSDGNGAYTFSKAYTTLKDAVNNAKTLVTAAGESVYIAMRRDYTTIDGENFTIKDENATVVIDLGGYTLNVAANKHLVDIHFDYANDSAITFKSSIVFKNGAIENNRSGGTSSKPVIAIGHAGTGSEVKEFEFVFENVTLAPNTSPIILGWNHSAPTGLKVNVILNGSTVDFTNSSEGIKAFVFESNYAFVKANITLSDCTVKASDLLKYNLYTKGDEDTVTLVPNADGVYLTVYQTSDALPILSGYVTSDGEETEFITTDDENVYALVVKEYVPEPDPPIVTPYGNIPAEYADASEYPLVVFKNGEYVGNSTTLYAGAYTAIALPLLKESADNTVVILLRMSLTEAPEGSIGSYEMKGKLIIDLGGNTFTSTKRSFFGTTAKAYKTYPNNPVIEVKNGTLNTLRLVQPYTQGNGLCTQYDITLTNVTIGRSSGYWPSLVATQVGAEYEGYSLFNLTFDNCTIDLRTNEKSSGDYTLFDLAPDAGTQVTNVVFKGGEIIFGRAVTFATFQSGYSSSTGYPLGAPDADSVKFEKGDDGYYTLFTYRAGADAPTDTYNSTDLTYVKVSDNGTDISYRLVPKAAADLKFVPRANITLSTGFVFNIYVPNHESLTALTLDGHAVDISTLTEKDGYYVISVELGASRAARNIKLVATLNAGGESINGTFTFSIPKYAEKLLSDTGATETEKTLVRDVLAYIKAAYAYFKVSDPEAIAKIDAIIGADYEGKLTVEGSSEANVTGLKSATFVLNATPSVRFYLPDGADASLYEFFIGGNRVNTKVSENGDYIDIEVYAYALCETVTYTIGGVQSGSYHINAYRTYVSGSEYTDSNKAELVALTESFWLYCQSARAYRNSVIGG